ncbi:MAG: histidine kinase [Chitinophagaceae bacterium]|nr:histidine kinase [Chitinophagaceae bacterium]
MKRTTLHSERLLFQILVTLLIVAGFQGYWLFDNYTREKKSLAIKTNMALRESVFELQASKLKLGVRYRDSGTNTSTVRVFVNDTRMDRIDNRPDIDNIEMINVLSDKERDTTNKRKIVVSLNHNTEWYNADSAKRPSGPNDPRDKFMQLLSGVDSLHDTLTVKEIRAKFSEKIKEDKTIIPFSIVRIDSSTRKDLPFYNEVTLGFAKPVTYQLQLGNTFPFLLRKILGPILFSVFLIGVTILSFILLYRSLLKQQRLSVMKNEFISNITHELKTPIATVGVAIEALRSFGAAESPEKTREYLDISASELQRLGLLVDKVLKLSMFENREVELKKESFDLRDLVNEVLKIMRLQFEKHQAAVSIKTEGSHFIIEADRLHMISVLYNLLDNALKYSSEHPVIEVQIKELPRDIIELRVSDNGIGIAKEYQSKIFEKFFRVPMGDQHNIKGYGLGLSYVSEIVHRHMGYIVADSEPGKGTVFTIRIPRKEADVIYFDDKRRIYKKSVKNLLATLKDKQHE